MSPIVARSRSRVSILGLVRAYITAIPKDFKPLATSVERLSAHNQHDTLKTSERFGQLLGNVRTLSAYFDSFDTIKASAATTPRPRGRTKRGFISISAMASS